MVVLTKHEEEKLLGDYSKIAWNLVWRFSSGKGSSIFSQDDLYQECMLVFVKHMRKCETKEQLRRFHTMDLINAMTRFVLKNQVLKIDHNRTNQARLIIENAARRVSLEEIADVVFVGEDPIERLLEEISYEEFCERELSDRDRSIIDMRREGKTLREVGRHCGITDAGVSIAMKRLRRRYKEFAS